MKRIYQNIWKLALKYQDARADKGHARITLNFAKKLIGSEKGNSDVIIPAIILHDIGWNKLSKKERFLIFESNKTEKKEREVRVKHQKEGVKLAEMILNKVNYNKNLSKHILEIISQHDTRVGCFSKEDSLMRDADRLWRFSKTGFWADVRRLKIPGEQNHKRMEKALNKKGFLHTKSAKRIASQELNRRKREFKK